MLSSPNKLLCLLLSLLCCPASGLLVAPARPGLRATRCGVARLQGETDIAKDDRVLVTIESLSSDYRLQMEAALEERNKERILTGQPRYEDIEDMVTKYQEFEGEKLGMSRAEAEDAVLSYLQKKALMDEGAYSGDPQEVITFVLLGALVVGVGYNLIVNGIPQ
mmetsp:Transcript_44832/g.144302  ORF Transcript_44832/g.144302 Transcript_44832/m.144302 type:complete len:164 (-) Transcript_44832:248-739(-)